MPDWPTMRPLEEAEYDMVSGGGFFQNLFRIGSHDSNNGVAPASVDEGLSVIQSLNVGIGQIIAGANSTVEINIIALAGASNRRRLLGA